ncbi:MAG: hypothetical protein ACFCAD_02780, partial [Pleurocapsa sp.]
MLRRYFLLQILIGWFLSVGSKIPIPNLQKSSFIATSKKINPKVEPMLFFIATNGNDNWSGKQATVARDTKNGPFATWKKAQAVIREIKKQNNGLNQPIKVIFSGGTYQLTEPIIFTPEDSGTKSFPISYEAASQQQVTISGGQEITGWQEQKLNGLRLWTTTLPASLQGVNFQHLWVNDGRRMRARYPNEGYLNIKSVSRRKGQNWYDGDRKLTYKIKDLPPGIEPTGSEAVVLNRWVESRLPVAKIDRKQQILHFEKESVFKLAANDLYYLENKLEFLDTPGEWYLDREEYLLYYLPLATEAIASAKITVPLLDTLIIFRDKVKKNLTVEHLEFNNLTFAHTDSHLPPTRSGYNQNAWGVSSAIVASGINDCRWRYCTWKHLGGYGIELFRRRQHNHIVGRTFFDLGAGLIKLGEKKVYRP